MASLTPQPPKPMASDAKPEATNTVSGQKRKRHDISKKTDPKVTATPDAPVAANWQKLRQKLDERVSTHKPKTAESATTTVVESKQATMKSVTVVKTTSNAPAAVSVGVRSSVDHLVAMGASFNEKGIVSSVIKSSSVAAIIEADRMRDPKFKASVLGPFDKDLSVFERGFVALDCEMVGVGSDGRRSELAQVVVVDFAGRVLYNKYVKPKEKVTDYRTDVSGVRPEHLVSAPTFEEVQKEVSELVKDKVIVGHSLKNDLHALLLGHSWKRVRDTATYAPFCYRNKAGKIRPRKLKHLCQEHLKIIIQEGEHEPAEDARAALALYRRYQKDWERSLLHGKGEKSGRKPKLQVGIQPQHEGKDTNKRKYGWAAKKADKSSG